MSTTVFAVASDTTATMPVTVTGVIAAARTSILTVMHEHVAVTRDAGAITDAVLNETSGELEPPAPVLVWEGPALINDRPAATRRDGHATVAVHAPTGRLPWHDTDTVRVGDILTVTASAEPALVGRAYRITAVGARTHAVTRQLDLERVERTTRRDAR